MTYDVICVGSALLDIFLKSEKLTTLACSNYPDGLAMAVEYGGKTEMQEAEVTSGGGGTNNAVSFARKGLKVALLAEVGRDLVAATIKEELIRERVDLSMLVEMENEETGLSSILVTPDGGRSALIYRGASKMLSKEDVRWNDLQSKWMYISSLGGEMALFEGLMGHAKTMGIKLAVNPGKSELMNLREWGGMELFNGTEVLLLNREEAQMLTGLNLEDEQVWRGDWQLPGVRYGVVTDGRNGGVVIAEGQRIWFKALEVPVIEETGAGDAFGSGLVAALMLGREITKAIEWGKKQAASVVSHMGAKKGLLRLDQLTG